MVCTVQQSDAETLDRLSITRIKKLHASSEKIDDVQRQIVMLEKACGHLLTDNEEMSELFHQLLDINKELWNLEDVVRTDITDDRFTAVAKQIFAKNDERAAVKGKINALTRSEVLDEKIRAVSNSGASSETKPLFILSHLGCGDMLLMAGAVKLLCQARSAVVVACKTQYKNTVMSLYRDIPNLKIVMLEGDPFVRGREMVNAFEELSYDVLRLGDHSDNREWQNIRGAQSWGDALYFQAGFFPEARYIQFPRNFTPDGKQVALLLKKIACIEESWMDEVPSYIFVHDDPARGYNVVLPSNSMPIIRPSPRCELDRGDSDDLFDYALLIALAKEAHFIDSAFSHLTDLLRLNRNVYMHTYARPHNEGCRALYTNRYDERLHWTFIDTPNVSS